MAAAPQITEEKQGSKLSINVDIEQSIVDEIIKKVYKEQLSCIAKLSENEPALLYFLAVGYANNRMPFLTWMVDAFTIDKQKDYTENNKTTAMSLEQWAKQNQFMIELTEKHPKKAEELKAAMKAYSKRMIPRLQYSPPTKIDDEMSEIVDYITSMPKFIESVLLLGRKQDSAGVSPPFCVDLCIAVKAVKSVVSVYHTNDEDDEDSDEDEDEDEYETEQKIQVLEPNEDHIGDVADKLEKANHRVYIRKDVALEDKPDDDAKDNTKFIRFTRCMVDGYKEFRTALREKKDHKFDDKNYPKDRRFGLFVDRRECKNKHKLNEMIFFEQMDKGGTIPKGFVSEWYINCQRECILPGIGDKKDKSIGAVDNVCGQLITFSFNVEAANEIKCYIIWNGQCMRWAGDNLEMILSYIFYNKCKELKQIKEALKTFNKQLKDIKFDEFYEKINNGYQPTDTVKPYGS